MNRRSTRASRRSVESATLAIENPPVDLMIFSSVCRERKHARALRARQAETRLIGGTFWGVYPAHDPAGRSPGSRRDPCDRGVPALDHAFEPAGIPPGRGGVVLQRLFDLDQPP